MSVSGDDFIYKSQYIQKVYAFLFVFGIITGTILLNIMLEYKGMILIEEMQKYHNLIKNSYEMDIFVFLRIWLYRLSIAVFLYISIQVLDHCYIMYPILFLWGNSFGYTLSLLTFQYGWLGLVCMFFYLFPHYILYLPWIIVVLRETSSQMNQALKLFLGHAVVIFILILLGSGVETYINPIFLKIFLKKFL